MKKILISIILISLFTNIILAQNSTSKYGDDSIQCVTNLSVYVEFVKTGMYDYAYDSWKYVFTHCPASSKNMYTHGVKIMKDKIENAKDEVKKEGFIDTLMLIYDRRIEYFGQEGYVLGRKGLDVLRYRKTNFEEANKYFKKSVSLEGMEAEASIIVQYMQTTSILFQLGKTSREEVIQVYAQCIDLLSNQLKMASSSDETDRLNTAINNVEIIFEKSGAANCESIIKLFTPRFENGKENIDLLKKITRLLNKFECAESELFYKSSENLYKLEPSAESAYMLAKMFLKKGNYEKSTIYYKEAIENQTDSIDKSRYYYELGVLTHSQQSNPELARSYAYNSIKNNPKDGKPYILIGNIYAASTKECGETEFEQSAVYWAVVDKFITAKKVDPELTDAANELITTYSKYFPGSEDTFFYGYSDGQDYTVGCWIKEKTKVRFE